MKPLLNLLPALALALLSTSASAYFIEPELTGGQAGNPAQDLYKVTISGAQADGGGADTFTVNWRVPVADTNGAPADLTAEADFVISSFTHSQLVLDVALRNTFDPNLGVNSLVAFGFFVDPAVTEAEISWDQANATTWQTRLDTNLTGNFQDLDVCVFPDENNNCNGGNQQNGLSAGASDSLTLTLTGDFADGIVMLSEFPVKFQGDWGSFQVPGVTDCCDGGNEVPEPFTSMLLAAGIAAGYPLRRRRFRAA